jgi:hypothetical protein
MAVNHEDCQGFLFMSTFFVTEIDKFHRILLHCGVTKVLGDVLGIVLVGLRDTRLTKQN